MKKNRLKWSLGLLLLLGSVLSLRAQNFEWAGKMSGPLNESGSAITTDATGNVLLAGTFNDTTDFDPGTGVYQLISGSDGGDGYVVKLTASGNLLWAKGLKGDGFAAVENNAITTDAAGNVYVTGLFFGVVDFDPGTGVTNLSSTNEVAAFVLKLDASGNLLWAQKMAGDNSGYNDMNSYDIVVDNAGNVYCTGKMLGTIDFDPGAGTLNLSSYSEDIFMAKFNSSGMIQWAKQAGGTFNDAGRSLTFDAAGNVYVAGYFAGPVDFDPGAGTATLNASAGEGFVLKLNSGGDFVWARQAGGAAYGIRHDASGHLYLSGSFMGTKDFDPGTAVANLVIPGTNPALDPNIFIARWDTAGAYNWAKQIGAYGTEDYLKLYVDAPGNIYLSGRFPGTMDCDPGTGVFNLAATNGEAFIVKLNTLGNFSWAKQLPAFVADIAADVPGNIYTTGSFGGTRDFDPGAGVFNMTAGGSGYDIFVHKLGVCTPVTTNVPATACASYTFLGQTYTATGNYSQAFTSASGCDSIVTLNLVLQSNGSTLTQNACDSFILNGQSYLGSGTYTQNFTNVQGCDSLVTLHLTVHTSSQGTLTLTACDSFVLDGQTYLASGIYNQVLSGVWGCDSMITLDLTLNHASTNNITAAACDSFRINGSTYFSSGDYTQTFPNTLGCDSVITLSLTITVLDRGITKDGSKLSATQAGASWQWLDCDMQSLIPGATQQTFTAAKNGRYAAIVTKNGCSDTTACEEITGLSIGSIWIDNVISVAPNPAKERITLWSDIPLQQATCSLISMLGQHVLLGDRLNGNRFSIGLGSFAPGVYIIEVKSQGKVFRTKLLKE